MRLAFIFIAFLFVNCGGPPTADELVQLNGYWEIEKVIFADGVEKEYKINAMVDYFKVEEMSGYRKKVQPLFDGTFDTSDDAQSFTLEKVENKFSLHYTNALSAWTESIESLNETRLILKNKEGVRYYYKKFESLKLSE